MWEKSINRAGFPLFIFFFSSLRELALLTNSRDIETIIGVSPGIGLLLTFRVSQIKGCSRSRYATKKRRSYLWIGILVSKYDVFKSTYIRQTIHKHFNSPWSISSTHTSLIGVCPPWKDKALDRKHELYIYIAKMHAHAYVRDRRYISRSIYRAGGSGSIDPWILIV